MSERDMRAQGNGRRFRIDADADTDETAIEIVLPDTLPRGRQPDRYRVVKKDISDDVKSKTFRNKAVLWINNFGIRLKGNFGVKGGGNKQDPFFDEVDGEEFSYEVVVPGSAPAGYPTLVYFDGNEVQPAPNVTTESDGYHFKLSIGDPPTGWGGGG